MFLQKHDEYLPEFMCKKNPICFDEIYFPLSISAIHRDSLDGSVAFEGDVTGTSLVSFEVVSADKIKEGRTSFVVEYTKFIFLN